MKRSHSPPSPEATHHEDSRIFLCQARAGVDFGRHAVSRLQFDERARARHSKGCGRRRGRRCRDRRCHRRQCRPRRSVGRCGGSDRGQPVDQAHGRQTRGFGARQCRHWHRRAAHGRQPLASQRAQRLFLRRRPCRHQARHAAGAGRNGAQPGPRSPRLGGGSHRQHGQRGHEPAAVGGACASRAQLPGGAWRRINPDQCGWPWRTRTRGQQ